MDRGEAFTAYIGAELKGLIASRGRSAAAVARETGHSASALNRCCSIAFVVGSFHRLFINSFGIAGVIQFIVIKLRIAIEVFTQIEVFLNANL